MSTCGPAILHSGAKGRLCEGAFEVLSGKLNAEDLELVLSEIGYAAEAKSGSGDTKRLAMLLLHKLTQLHKYEGRTSNQDLAIQLVEGVVGRNKRVV